MLNCRQVLCVACIGALLPGVTQASDWPQFRGPNRDGKSSETGLLKEWAEGGPKLLRTITGIGEGYSSPSISKGRIFITGQVGKELFLRCFDLAGKKVWEARHGPAWVKSYPGARSSPTIDGDRVYLLGGKGRLVAYHANSGKEIWSTELVGKLGGRLPVWGYAESLLIDGKKLICTPGGPNVCFAAFDRMNGRLLWTSKEVSARPEYGSPILVELGNVRQIVSMTRGGLFGISPRDGKKIWGYNRPENRKTSESFTANCNSPVYADGYVFEATGYQSRGGGAVKLTPKGGGIEAKPAWRTKDMNCEVGGYVIVDGHIYGNNGKGYSCIELKTGKTKWTGRGPGKGSLIYADGMLYCLSEKGTMGLLEAKPDGYNLVSSFTIPKARPPAWAHPVISDGKLYLRRSKNLYVHSVKK